MRGDGRTPRGLRAQQITSHAAGGTSRFVAPNHGRRAIKKGSTQMQDATRYQAPKPLRPADLRPGPLRQPQPARVPTGGHQSQSKNPSRQPTIQFTQPHFKGCILPKQRQRASGGSSRQRHTCGPTPKSEVVTKICPVMHLKGWA